MAEGIKQGFVSEDKGTKKAFLYKPFERKKQAWVAMVQNLIVKNTNEELTSALKRMSEAEEIPIKWNKINKPKFMNFMKHIMENKEDYARDVKLWDLVARDIEEKKFNKAEENENKLRKDEKVLAPVIAIKPMEAKPNKPTILPKCQKKNKLEKVLAPVTKPVDVPVNKNTSIKTAVLPKSQMSLDYKTKNQTEWTRVIQNLIQTHTNENEELRSALKNISTAKNFPLVKRWKEIQKAKFENFLNNIPGYKVNPIIDEQLRILISRARQEEEFKEKNEKYLTKSYSAKPIQNEKNSEWLALFKSFFEETVSSSSEELPSDAYVRISQHVKIPKNFYGMKNPDFKKFLKNNLDCEVNPKIADQLWDLILKALKEQQAKKNNILANKKATNQVKATKRKNDSENKKPAVNGTVNGTSVKRIKKEVETKSLDNDLSYCNPVNDTTAVCKEAPQSIKVKWNTIGKTILRAQDGNEMSLKKFQKKIITEYLKRAENTNCAESAEFLWCKCQKKLSKNSKFQIDADKIKLVSLSKL